MSLRVLSIVGTRPEAVKMAPVILALRRQPGIESYVCATAQHRQMLDQVLSLFQIQPDFDLDLMRPNQTLAGVTTAILAALDPVLEKLQPDWLLAQGDTTTVMAAALLAYYRRIRFGHVEAGLRTGDKWQPFPEEINRRIAGVVADLHFAPTAWARDNLLREGVPPAQVLVTGNPVIDALQQVATLPPDEPTRRLLADLGGPEDLGCPDNLGGPDERPGQPRLVLMTAHRRENFGPPLEQICAAVRRLAETYGPALQIVYPVHLNPNVQEPVHRLLGGLPNVHLLPPLDYLPLVHLLRRAHLALTDSGGLQEEAPALGVPVLVLRNVTERPEGLAAGCVRLVGTDPDAILAAARQLIDDPAEHARMAHAANPYGDGRAAGRIVAALLDSDAPDQS